MTQKGRTFRLQVELPPDEARAIDDFWFRERFPNWPRPSGNCCGVGSQEIGRKLQTEAGLLALSQERSSPKGEVSIVLIPESQGS